MVPLGSNKHDSFQEHLKSDANSTSRAFWIAHVGQSWISTTECNTVLHLTTHPDTQKHVIKAGNMQLHIYTISFKLSNMPWHSLSYAWITDKTLNFKQTKGTVIQMQLSTETKKNEKLLGEFLYSVIT